MAELNRWIEQARKHWQANLPTLYRDLKQAGTLDKTLRAAAEATYRETSQLEASGYRPDEAFQMVRENHLFPPAEPKAEKPTSEEQSRNERLNLLRQAMSAVPQDDPDEGGVLTTATAPALEPSR